MISERGVGPWTTDAVCASHPGVCPPLELGLPPAAYGDDGHLGEPPLDRRAESQRSTKGGEVTADVRRVHECVERAGEPARGGHELATPGADYLVPHLLAGRGELVTTELGQSVHTPTIILDVGGARPGPQASDVRPQTLLMPPSTTMSEPVMNELSSEARNSAALASSSGCASLCMGV